LEQNEEDLKKTKDKALLKMKEAQELMEKAQKMDKLIADKKRDMEKRLNKIKKEHFEFNLSKSS